MIADTPRTHAELLKLLTDNTSGAITPQVLRDPLVSLDLYPLNVKRFGAKDDGLADDTAAIQAAIAESHVYPPDRYLPVYFPPGDYLCHEVAWNGKAPLVGFEVGNSRLLYNGPGGPKSAVIRYEEDKGATPYAGFSNLTFIGMDIYSSTAKIAEHCYLRVGTTGTDWGSEVREPTPSQLFRKRDRLLVKWNCEYSYESDSIRCDRRILYPVFRKCRTRKPSRQHPPIHF